MVGEVFGVLALANRDPDSGNQDVRNLATALLRNFERFFTFPEKDGVEPTNNPAERALRCAVQWRKTSFGSRSADEKWQSRGCSR
jgi:transposase